ncbi:MAG: phosphoglucosamine mutase, partial [Steroidobacteraceae bacterium]
QLLYVLALAEQAAGRLRGPVVGTVMTNFALESALRDADIDFLRAQVGDRYVLAKLRETGGTLGGETSGHLLTLQHTTTGDAMVAALQVLGIMRRSGRTLAELTAGLTLLPQTMLNVRVARRFDPLAEPAIVESVTAIESQLAGRGRVVLRASGTEPVIRVMIEAEDREQAKDLAQQLAKIVQHHAEHGVST